MKHEEINKELEAYIKEEKCEAVKEFAKFLIDKSENGVIHISDLPDYVVEKNKEVGNARNNLQR